MEKVIVVFRNFAKNTVFVIPGAELYLLKLLIQCVCVCVFRVFRTIKIITSGTRVNDWSRDGCTPPNLSDTTQIFVGYVIQSV